MRLRPSRGKVNAPEELRSGLFTRPGPCRPFSGRSAGQLTLRSAVILGAALLAGFAAGTLTWLATASLPAALLAVGPAGAGCVTVLNAIIG